MKSLINGLTLPENLFLENKYQNWYISIINRGILRQNISKPFHIHHIIPRALGGTEEKNNLVKLTLKEHFICHLLLTKFCTQNIHYYKMLKAITFMKKFTKSSKLYDKIQSEYLKFHSKRISDYMKIHSPFKNKEVHQKTINTRTKNKTNIFETRNPMKFDSIAKKRKLKKTSGNNHWLRKSRNFYYKLPGQDIWNLLDISYGIGLACSNLGWSLSTFNLVLTTGKPTKKGPMAGVLIKRELI